MSAGIFHPARPLPATWLRFETLVILVSLVCPQPAFSWPAVGLSLNLPAGVTTSSTSTTTLGTTTSANLTSSTTSRASNVDDGSISAPFSMAAESAITFISVFIIGCVIVFSVYSWKKLSPAHWRVPQPYQYSALSQFDNDPDEEINDLDDHLEMLVEDSSSEDLDEEEKESGAKDVKVDSNEPATLPVSSVESGSDPTKTSRRLTSVSSLLDESDEELIH